jgi:ATP-dependent helicase HrpA
VEVRYAPPESDEENSGLPEQTAAAVTQLVKESRRGDILAFLPTEQDIRETMDVVSRSLSDRLEILPLFARLPASEQKKAFKTGGRRKLVVATNVAETSLTIPGIRYVVDSGLARISRYNPGTGTHGLPVDPISRASADQRAGRCGRVEDGICVRLYSEEDYLARPEYTLPEIRRTNLAEVILRLLDIGISDIENFPFVDSPDSQGIRDGLRTLKEIGALKSARSEGRRLTKDGRLMAKLPLDPRLAKVLLQADREGCMGDVLPIAAALSLPDPRERPPEKAGSADAAHRKFTDELSDFMGWLNIWDGFRQYGKKGSYSGKLKKYCQENFLSFRRMKEWMDIHWQLTLAMEDGGYRPKRVPSGPSLDSKGEFSRRYASIHRALLSGFLSHIARREEKGVYEATRNRKARIHPGSALRNASPLWIMAAEIVRTSRIYARSVAAIDPGWLLDLGSELVTRNWLNPHWSRKAGAVMATEQVRLFGFLISGDGSVPYGKVKPDEAREIFIRSALVEGDIAGQGSYGFLKANRRLLDRLGTLEDKLRRRDLVAGEDAVAEFYATRLPKTVLDLGTLNQFIRSHGEKTLLLTEEDVLTGEADPNDLILFPDKAEIAGDSWTLSYVFDPESDKDGVTLKIPAGRLSDLTPDAPDWMVPGLLEDKVEALMRGLPKAHRKRLIPIPETAAQAISAMESDGKDLVHALSEWLYREKQIDIPPDEWDVDGLPENLRVRFSLLDDSGREIADGRDPASLMAQSPVSKDSGRSGRFRKKMERTGLIEWPGGDIPESVTIEGGARLWPGLKDDGDSVSLRYYDQQFEAVDSHRRGQVRLAGLHWAREIRDFRRQLILTGEARTNAAYLGGASILEDALWKCVLADLFGKDAVFTEIAWRDMLSLGGQSMFSLAQDYLGRISVVLEAYGKIRRLLSDLEDKSHRGNFVKDRIRDAEELIQSDFIERYDPDTWKSLPRWLDAIVSRARKGIADPGKDDRALQIWQPLKETLEDLRNRLSPMASEEKRMALKDASVMLQELKVGLFAAGDVRAVGKVSESRMKKRLEEIRRML